MNYNEALKYIHSLGKFGSKPGLERIEKMLSLMGNPHKKLKFIHVAGTNGKGSTSTYIANVLQKAGYKTGLYTSPFITEFNERININGQNISNVDLAEYTAVASSKAKMVFSEEYPITEFEFITAVAFKYFYDSGCDIVVLEVGLGGRLDATNVIEKSLASVITKIDLDHTDILGDTIEKIASEKCGIIKQNCPVITTSKNEQSVIDVVRKYCDKSNSNLHLNDSQTIKVISSNVDGNVFVYNGHEYRTKMAGQHQIDNAVTAIKALQVAFPDIPYSIVYEGIEKAVLPARCELISKVPVVLLDGCHNPNGTLALDKMLESSNINFAVAIVGFMADKDVGEAISNVAYHFDKMIAVEVKTNKRSMTSDDLSAVCKLYCADVQKAESYQQAIEIAVKENKPIVVFGSLYLAGDIRPLLLSRFTTKNN